MFCENCGKELKETDKFCMQCGFRVTEDEVASEITGNIAPAGEAAPAGDSGFVEMPMAAPLVEEPVKKQKKGFKKPAMPSGKSGLIIGIVAAVAVFVLVIGLNFRVMANFVMKTFTSPENYYHYVEKMAFAENAETIANYYDAYVLKGLNTEAQGYEGEIKLELGDDMLDLVEGVAAEASGLDDWSWLQSVSIKASAGRRETISGGSVTLGLGKEDILKADAIVDFEEGALYFGLPELLEDYIYIEMSEDYSYEWEEMQQIMKMMEELYEKVPDKKTAEKLLYRYLCIAIESIDEVDKKTDELEVEDISKKYTRLKVTLDQKATLKMAKAVMKEMKSDKELKKIILDVASVQEDIDPDDLYDEFKEELEWYLDEIDTSLDRIDDYESDEKFVMFVYVDGKGRVCGREIRHQDGKEVRNTIGYKMPQKGKKFGFEMYADTEEGKASVQGSGKRSGKSLSGEFVCTAEDMDLFEVVVTDYNTEEIKKGYLNGKFVMNLCEESGADDMLPGLSDYKIECTVSMKEDANDMTVSVLDDEDMMVTLQSSFKGGKKDGLKIPDEDNIIVVDDEEDLQKLVQKFDFEKLIDSLEKAGLPSDITDTIEFYVDLM